MKHRKDFKERLAVIICAIILGCNNQHTAADTTHTADSTPVSTVLRPVMTDSMQKEVDTTKSFFRQVTSADEQYLTLTIPDYSEIVFHHETGKEALNFVQILKQYFILRKCSINGDSVMKDTTSDAKKKRFYIQHVGDNRFVITVYNEYGDERHP